MRTPVLAMLFIFQAFASTALAQTDREIPVEIERLSDRVAVFRIGAAQETNVTALKSSRGIVVVDAEMSPTFAAPDHYFMLHPELDTFAYRLMLDDKLDDALKIFLVLAELFPEADVAFDSLGEVYIRLDKKEDAIKSFEAALRLNTDNQNSARRLNELKKPPPQT